MNHPTTRLLTALEVLQSCEQISGGELAARLEVDPRTVRRYMMMLQDMGIPIGTELGRHGGYSLLPGFKLPPMMFTNEEVLAVILGLLVVRHLGLNASACSIEGAMLKLRRVLPDVLRQQADAIQSALVLDFVAPEQQVKGSILSLLGQAIHARRQTAIIYRTEHDETSRSVDPYGLVCQTGVWYLVGYCHLRSGMRIFRVDRIVEVNLQDETFTPPEGFDSLEYLIQSFATMPDRWDIEVILNTTLERASKAIPPSMGLLDSQAEGVLFRTSVGDLDQIARFLVGLGFPITIVQPPELRVAFERLAKEILQIARETV